VTIGFANAAECISGIPSDPACDVTVGEAEDCFADINDASDADICAGDLPASCAPLAAAACN
jgi:hypothetical protein